MIVTLAALVFLALVVYAAWDIIVFCAMCVGIFLLFSVPALMLASFIAYKFFTTF